MKDDLRHPEARQAEALNDLLARWHVHCKGYSIVRQCRSDPMFRNARSRPDWDSADEVNDKKLTAHTLEAVDFHVNEISEPYRSAIHETARNLHTGFAVWRSPRLPRDSMERVRIVVEARRQISQRLLKAGVLQK